MTNQRLRHVFSTFAILVMIGLQSHTLAQCSNSTQPISTVRLASGPININTDGFGSVPVVAGVPSATAQVT